MAATALGAATQLGGQAGALSAVAADPIGPLGPLDPELRLHPAATNRTIAPRLRTLERERTDAPTSVAEARSENRFIAGEGSPPVLLRADGSIQKWTAS